MRMEFRGAANDLLVARVRLHGVDAYDDRLVHRARDDDATTLHAAAAVALGLRKPRDGLAAFDLLSLRLRALPALAPRLSSRLRGPPDGLGRRSRLGRWSRSLLALGGRGLFRFRERLFGGRLLLGGSFLGGRLLGRSLLSRRLFGLSSRLL